MTILKKSHTFVQELFLSERIIKDLIFSSRTLVLHAQRHWPEYITNMFWPFSLVEAADRMNYLHVDMHGQTPEMNFQTL